jgi:hypothetical protein
MLKGIDVIIAELNGTHALIRQTDSKINNSKEKGKKTLFVL